MEQGWIKLHRQILDNLFLMHDDNAFMVFTKLLMLVNKRNGTYAAGRNQLGETLHMNPRTLYGVLIRLEDQGMIAIESHTRYSVITIANWEKYQSSPNSGETVTSTDNSTLTKQGSNSNRATDYSHTAQQQLNSSSTAAQHSNKNKEVRIKNNKGFDFSEYQELEPELKSFIEMRKVIRKPATATALKLTVNKLRAMYPDDVAKQKECLNQSIERSWAGVFELKDSDSPKKEKSWF